MCSSADRARRTAGAVLFALALVGMGERGLAQEHETIESTAIRLLDEGLVALRSGKCSLAMSILAESSRLAPRYPFLCRNAECAHKCAPLRAATLQALLACQTAAESEKGLRMERNELEATAEAERLEVWAADAAHELLSRLPQVVIRAEQLPTGLVVRLDGLLLADSQIGVPIAVDPGGHRVDADAPGHMSFVRWFEAAEASMTDVEVEIEPAPAPAEPPPPPEDGEPVYTIIDSGTMLPTGSFLMPGVSVALVFDRSEDIEFSVGGELSLATLNTNLFWAGSYVDALYSTQSDETRLSVGPEFGIGFFGVDAGYLLKLGGEHGTQHGINLRPMLTAGAITAYFRSSWLLGSHADWSGEVGLLFKLPIELN